MSHNPVLGARALIELFEMNYLRALVVEIGSYLKQHTDRARATPK